MNTTLSKLDELKKQVEKCKSCSLCETRNNIVFSDGSQKAPIMFIGEAPGDNEDKTGIPFIGRAGQLLRKFMFEAGFEKGLNAVFCGHDHNNDWCGIYKGVYLAYNLPQNYNLYHLGTHMGFPEEKWNQGVTVTNIHADGGLDIAPRYNSMYL